MAVSLGYKNVYRDPYGFPKWQAHGLPIASSPVGLSEPTQANPSSSLQGWAMLWTLLGIFAGGLALNLTPCVYPMIPITASFKAFAWLKTIAGTVCLVLSTLWITAWAMSGPGIEWRTWSEQTLRQAIEQGKPVIIDFYADWCAP